MVAFLEKLIQRLKKPKTPKEGVDYELYHFEETDLSGIHLIKGEYRGVIYYYKGAKFSEDEGYPKLSFKYEIYQTGNKTHAELINDAKFDKLMGDILIELLVNNETRADDLKKSDL